MSTEIIGLDNMIKDFAKFGQEGMEKIRPKVDDAGDALLSATRVKLSAVTRGGTGNLSRSLYLKRPRNRKAVMKYQNTLTWKNDVRDYGAPLELGHAIRFQKEGRIYGHVAPRPFLRPTVDEQQDKILDTITKGMDNALKELGGK